MRSMLLILPLLAATWAGSSSACGPGVPVPELWPDPRTQPVCGIPKDPNHCDKEGRCTMIGVVANTYAHCPALLAAEASFRSWGRCRDQAIPQVTGRTLTVGLRLRDVRDCVVKVTRLDQVPVDVAPWLSASGHSMAKMSPHEFCRRLFSDTGSLPPLGTPAEPDAPVSSGAAAPEGEPGHSAPFGGAL